MPAQEPATSRRSFLKATALGEDRGYAYEEVIPKALAMVRQQIKASKYPGLPLYLTEWSSQNPAFIAQTIKSCVGLPDMMSCWTFDNVYEELGVPKTFMNSAFGLVGMRGVPRPSFNTFALLHQLGEIELPCDDGPVLATRRADGSLAILLWNLLARKKGEHTLMGDPLQQTEDRYISDGLSISLQLKLRGAGHHRRAHLTRVDDEHGSAMPAYRRMLGTDPYECSRDGCVSWGSCARIQVWQLQPGADKVARRKLFPQSRQPRSSCAAWSVMHSTFLQAETQRLWTSCID